MMMQEYLIAMILVNYTNMLIYWRKNGFHNVD